MKNLNEIEYEMKLKNLTNLSSMDFIEKNNTYSISPCNKILNKEFLLRNNLFFKENIFFEDNHFFIRFYNNATNISSVDKVFYIRREREGSTIRSVFSEFKLESLLEIVNEISKIKSKELSNIFIDNQLYWAVESFLKKTILFEDKIRSKNIQRCFSKVAKIKIHSKDSMGLKIKKLLYNYNKKVFLKCLNIK